MEYLYYALYLTSSLYKNKNDYVYMNQKDNKIDVEDLFE